MHLVKSSWLLAFRTNDSLPKQRPMEANHHFSRQAVGYARYRPDYPDELIRFILSQINGYETLWDVGTGNGQLARQLAPFFQRVYATDHSAEQLQQAHGTGNIQFIQCRAEQTPLPDHQVDLVTAAQSIHWFDRPAFYREVRRTGKTNGWLAAIGYGLMQAEGLEEPLRDFHQRTFGEFLTRERQLVDGHYAHLDFPFKEVSCPEFSNSYTWDLPTLEGYFNTWSSVQKYIDRYHTNPVPDLIAEIHRVYGNQDAVPVTFSYFLRLGRIQ